MEWIGRKQSRDTPEIASYLGCGLLFNRILYRALPVVMRYKILGLREQGTGNREQGIGNRE
ncbi:hypothetical protein AFK68_02500 [Hydrocoleum sp. CS-953]|nr:hypothetical protein AFK68_02500 [Hydrocoleum sp. CS-953]